SDLWVHRIRFTCKTCHMSLFEPQAGANRVTMADIDQGRACGACHNGRTAFEAGFNECHRCHVSPDAPVLPPVADTTPPPPPDTADHAAAFSTVPGPGGRAAAFHR
ncbi:MAG: hypothetical protein OEO23_11100, partial [Gemmatimonadota bacterium]|nr:hypothetical protein [Gemmatimonadota bacterium]